VTQFDWTQYYVDVTVPNNAQSFHVRLHPLGRFKGTVWFDLLEVEKINPTDLMNQQMIPSAFNLFQNYPNPFNPSTRISYSLPQASYVKIKIYDLLGVEVKTLLESEQSAGLYNIQWNGENNFGSKVSSGTYIYRLEAGNFVQSKKMVLLK
ncbi:MAG: T9SS type A sorting domain-containing protein, partial [Ignavibacteriaceae bacterium]|nr:T9SS type A sorting domain-containing protein [Ignavibacteriaceae bacterium]